MAYESIAQNMHFYISLVLQSICTCCYVTMCCAIAYVHTILVSFFYKYKGIFILYCTFYMPLKLWDSIHCTFAGIFRLDAWNKVTQNWR